MSGSVRRHDDQAMTTLDHLARTNLSLQVRGVPASAETLVALRSDAPMPLPLPPMYLELLLTANGLKGTLRSLQGRFSS